MTHPRGAIFPSSWRWILTVALLACAVAQGKPAIAPESGNSRANDHLFSSEFEDPPVNARPGSFWSWLNGSITPGQITRDLEAMKTGGMRGGEIWDVAAHADPDKRVPAGSSGRLPPQRMRVKLGVDFVKSKERRTPIRRCP